MNEFEKVYLQYFSLLENAIKYSFPSKWAYDIIKKENGSNLANKAKSMYIKYLNENNHEERKKLIKRLDEIKRTKETPRLINKAFSHNQNSRRSFKRKQQDIDFEILQNRSSDKRSSDPRDFEGASRGS